MMKKTGVNIYSELSSKYNLPVPIIKVICNHPFLFANRKITEFDKRPLMFAYLGKIKLKKIYEKDSQDTEDAVG